MYLANSLKFPDSLFLSLSLSLFACPYNSLLLSNPLDCIQCPHITGPCMF